MLESPFKKKESILHIPLEEKLDEPKPSQSPVQIQDEINKLQNQEISAIIRTGKFLYIFVYFSIVLCVGNFYNINMKSLGLIYFPERFIISTVVYAPFCAGFGRIIGGYFINKFGFKKTQITCVICMLGYIYLFAAFTHIGWIFVLGFYVNCLLNGIFATCAHAVCLYVYGAELAAKLQGIFVLTQSVSLLLALFINTFCFDKFGLIATSADFAQFLILLCCKINYFND